MQQCHHKKASPLVAAIPIRVFEPDPCVVLRLCSRFTLTFSRVGMMDVYCNHLVQICPANNGQWHNTITLDIEKPNTLLFNEKTYQSRWTYTMDCDGQWSEISFSFSRHHHQEIWWTEHYIRAGPEIWTLLHRSQMPQEHHYVSAHGSFYDVPIKLLRLKAFVRGIHKTRFNARGYCPFRTFFWNAAVEALNSEEENDWTRDVSATPGPLTTSE